MSYLIDEPPHTITVYPEVDSTDSDGNPVRVPATTGVPVRVWMQPASAAESAAAGQAVTTTYKAFGRSFPAGPFARVEWDGRSWDVVGDPMRWDGIPDVAHVEVMLTARTARPI